MPGFRINTNISALVTYNVSLRNQLQVAKSIERLSSGKRINRAADDPAGYAVTEKMDSRIRGIRQAQQNVQDALSMLQVADGALASIQEMAHRIRQLSIQAATETYSDSDRKKIQDEINQLLEGIDDVAYNTEFNNIKILIQNERRDHQKSPVIEYQAYTGDYDWNNDGINDWTAEDMERLRKDLEERIIPAAFKKVYAHMGWGNVRPYNLRLHFQEDPPYMGAANNTDLYISLAYALGGKHGGLEAYITMEQLIAHEITHVAMLRETHAPLPEGAAAMWYIEGTAEWTAVADNEIKRRYGDTIDAGEAAQILQGSLTTWGDGLSIPIEYMEAHLAHKYIAMVHGAPKVTAIANAVKVGGAPNTVVPQMLGFANMAAFETAFEEWARREYLKAGTGQVGEHAKIDLDGLAYTHTNPAPLYGDTPKIHIGPNPWELLEVKIPDARAGALDFLAFANVLRQHKAEDTILTSGKAIDLLTTARSEIGSKMVRLETVLKDLREQEESQMAARSRIEDLDFAKEAMDLTRNQILAQSSLAMLTQANVAPQNVLGLI